VQVTPADMAQGVLKCPGALAQQLVNVSMRGRDPLVFEVCRALYLPLPARRGGTNEP